jgi:hydrogenase maturation protease
VGNVLLGDDGFGVAVAQALAAGPPVPDGVVVADYGVAGTHLAYDAAGGVDELLLVDTVPAWTTDSGKPAEPGELRLLELPAPVAAGASATPGDGLEDHQPPGAGEDGGGRSGGRQQPDDGPQQPAGDGHAMTPDQVLNLIGLLGGGPTTVRLVGCVPARTEEGIGLSDRVASAVGPAVSLVRDLLTAESYEPADAGTQAEAALTRDRVSREDAAELDAFGHVEHRPPPQVSVTAARIAPVAAEAPEPSPVEDTSTAAAAKPVAAEPTKPAEEEKAPAAAAAVAPGLPAPQGVGGEPPAAVHEPRQQDEEPPRPAEETNAAVADNAARRVGATAPRRSPSPATIAPKAARRSRKTPEDDDSTSAGATPWRPRAWAEGLPSSHPTRPLVPHSIWTDGRSHTDEGVVE